jgi:spermidine synthase
MRLRTAAVVVALTGFVSLSYEILWIRAWSFMTKGAAHSFGVLLGAYLLGLAAGSAASILVQGEGRTDRGDHLRALGAFLLGANLVGFLLVPAAARLVTVVAWGWTLPGVALAAALMGAVLPLVSQLSVAPDDRAGAALSYLYLANIAGSAAGSLLTGFVLMDHLPFGAIATGLALIGLGLSALITRAGGGRLRQAAVAAAAVVALSTVAHDGMWERLQRKGAYVAGEPFARVVETKSGVITTTADGEVHGGGAYDGKASVDLKQRTWLVRPYALSAVHPAPREVLMLGLASGSWARIVASNPEVERLTVVDINGGYRSILADHPEVASLLGDGKVTIEIDDGRRWLRRHPERLFDAVVINTTHHWRGYVSNLLSVEFLEMVRQHLRPGGIYLYNTTWSDDAIRTGLEVFPHAMMILNCMVVSDSPISFDRARWADVLRRYPLGDGPLFDPADPAAGTRLERILALADTLDAPDPGAGTRLLSAEQLRVRAAGARVITDDNMATEWGRW